MVCFFLTHLRTLHELQPSGVGAFVLSDLPRFPAAAAMGGRGGRLSAQGGDCGGRQLAPCTQHRSQAVSAVPAAVRARPGAPPARCPGSPEDRRSAALPGRLPPPPALTTSTFRCEEQLHCTYSDHGNPREKQFKYLILNLLRFHDSCSGFQACFF